MFFLTDSSNGDKGSALRFVSALRTRDVDPLAYVEARCVDCRMSFIPTRLSRYFRQNVSYLNAVRYSIANAIRFSQP